MVRRFDDAHYVTFDHAAAWRGEASGLWDAAVGEVTTPGPVHLNAAFVEPLIATPRELPERSPHPSHAPRAVEGAELSTLVLNEMSVLCVVGRGVTPETIDEARALQWVVLGDATANGTLAHFDALLRSAEFARRARPDVVVRLGGMPASKVLGDRLREWGARTVAANGAGFVADPDRLVKETFAGLPRASDTLLRADPGYVELWRTASDSVSKWLESDESSDGELSEPLVARTVVAASNESNVALLVGSSMPVRDVEWWAEPRTSHVFANRGVNGIDGVVSTAFGIAAGGVALALVGDLTMLHDVSGLVDGLGTAGGTCTLVVVDNQGGGIFSFLSQATALDAERFELLFGTPRLHRLDAIAEAFGHAAVVVSTKEELRRAIDKGLASEGVSVVVARVPSRNANVEIHQRWNDQVVTLMEGTK